jgi:poly-beta-1,6-N-acetyl-D-glucosamine biosynthesis protein PgaD
MTSPRLPTVWPPLISSARMPRAMLVRDTALTALAWFGFGMLSSGAIMLIEELVRSAAAGPAPGTGPDWQAMWLQLERFVLISAILIGWLLYWTIVRAKRMRAAGLDPQPPALPLADQAAAFHVNDGNVGGWREYRIATVHFDAADRIVEVEPSAAGHGVAAHTVDTRVAEP